MVSIEDNIITITRGDTLEREIRIEQESEKDFVPSEGDRQDEAGKIVICNPDRGRYRMPASVFDALYTGVSLWNGEPHDIVQA